MSYDYRGFDLNEYLEEPWYAVEQTLFTEILDFLPEKGDTLASSHYHSYIASASDESNLAASANNDGTLVFNQYTTDGVLQTYDSDGSVGATGIAAEIIGSGNISEAEYENLNGTETGIQSQIDALDNFKGYLVSTGVTGVPYWGDGFVEGYLTEVGTAVYSTDGSVYLMGESGFTGMESLLGCRFVTNAFPAGDNIKFVSPGAATSFYSSFGFTGGASANDSELHLNSQSSNGTKTSHLRLSASYGKVILKASTTTSVENGIQLGGYDGASANYTDAAAGKWRDLYADEDGNLVVGESDNEQRYKSSGFTAIITDTYMDVESYSWVDYELVGKVAFMHLADFQANSVNAQLVISNIPAELDSPGGTRSAPCVVLDFVNAPSGQSCPGRFYTSGNTWGTFNRARINGTSGEPEYFGDFGTTGVKGWVGQTLVLRVST